MKLGNHLMDSHTVLDYQQSLMPGIYFLVTME
uniref:Uncharacterized protein n=1 Tax=Arundo donax TaxID=35708 RepID=A0A0A9HDL2_ARUDO